MTASVDGTTIAAGRYAIGRLTLNAPKTLNSLTLDMVEMLASQLMQWRDDPRVVAVIIDGVGDKAFCAGGDVQALRQSAIDNPGGPCTYAETFFAREYRMNYLLHTYPKPVVCWGHGVVMGGGLGILAGCSHRVVSERTRIGMPEITIALFPDVGGSWFLNRMPGHVGRFLALTAANINATDALFCGLGTTYLAHSQQNALFDALSSAPWSDDEATNKTLMTQVLLAIASAEPLPEPQVEPLLETINTWMAGNDLEAIVSRIAAYSGDNPFLSKARGGLLHGSPLAACWIFHQLNQSKDYALDEVFRSELRLGTNILRHPEFAEGVRALLIDKDRNPQWRYSSVDAVPESVLAGFFSAPEHAQSFELPE